MSARSTSLAARRVALVAECAAQRLQVYDDLELLRSPASLDGAVGFMARHKTTLLAGAGVGIGLLATRPRWLLGGVTAALSLYRVAEKVLPMLVLRQRG